MQRINKLLSLCLVLILTVTSFVGSVNCTVSAEEITTAYIEGDNVNVRRGPSTGDTIIEKISHTSVRVLEKINNNTWLKITYHNGNEQITGYIFNDPSYIRVVTFNPDADFETKLSAFPESYRDALRDLKAKYPNWEFIPDPVALTFAEAVALESSGMTKQVSFTSQPVSWRSMGQGVYDWGTKNWIQTNDGWTGASREITAYYMDPRNFLNATEIYQFLQQSYDANYQNEEGVKKIIKGTFMETDYVDPNDTQFGGSYARVIMEAAKQAGVSPYILASKIKQEIGVSVTNMISGTYTGSNNEYYGYYNFFNIGASGASGTVLINGLKRAKQEGWNTRSKAIIGGAKFLSNNYISKGQDTYYYQDFNVHNPDSVWHQYAQAIHDANSKGKLMASSYSGEYEFALTFKIPVFTNMPESVSSKPVSNSKKNNYYFKNISVTGLTPSFSMYTYNYDLRLTDSATVYITVVDDAQYAGKESYKIEKGTNIISLKVKAETGYITDYNITIDATTDCTLTVKTGSAPVTPPDPTPSTPSEPEPTIKRGDTNGDGKITLSDLANVRLHLLGRFTLGGNSFTAADTNNDGKISLSDLANIRLHLLGLYTIS